jgi:hypothetical protein
LNSAEQPRTPRTIITTDWDEDLVLLIEPPKPELPFIGEVWTFHCRDDRINELQPSRRVYVLARDLALDRMVHVRMDWGAIWHVYTQPPLPWLNFLPKPYLFRYVRCHQEECNLVYPVSERLNRLYCSDWCSRRTRNQRGNEKANHAGSSS